MNRRIFIVSFAIALFWTSVITLAQEQAPVPSFKDGDTWQINITRKGQFVSSSETTYRDL